MTKKIIIKIEEGADTRWTIEPEKILEAIQLDVAATLTLATSGTIPRVTVKELEPPPKSKIRKDKCPRCDQVIREYLNGVLMLDRDGNGEHRCRLA